MEHFEERLDRWLDRHCGEPFFDLNVVTGANGFEHFAHLRAVDGNRFLFFGEEFALDELEKQMLYLLNQAESGIKKL